MIASLLCYPPLSASYSHADTYSASLTEESTDAQENRAPSSYSDTDSQSNPSLLTHERTITDVMVEGNTNIPTDAILNKISYRAGQIYSPLYARESIQNLMNMGYFKKISIEGEYESNNGIKLFVIVDEKLPLQEIVFKGNKNLSRKEIEKKIKLDDIGSVDEHDLLKYAILLKKMYQEKNFHNVIIQPEITQNQGKVIATFTVQEGEKTLVKRVLFEGNTTFSSKKLRSLIFTREDWIMGFMDRSGAYQPDAITADQHALEGFYQSNGFFNAKVTSVDVKIDEVTKDAIVTFHVHEGDIYTISDVSVQSSQEMYTSDQILSLLPITKGSVYSRENIREAMDIIRAFWGTQGYLYADVAPSIEPNDEQKTVKVIFFVEPGERVYINRITIFGNQKTRDKVIRRQLTVKEGELLTNQQLDESKLRIEGLGYFEQQGGVTWKISRLASDNADVDFMVREVKTGRLEAQLGFGGSPKDLSNPTSSARIGASISDTNLLGLGIGFNLNGAYSKEEQQLALNITQPWLFDRPIYAALDTVFKHSLYSDFKFTQEEIKERLASASLSSGFISQKLNGTKFVFQLGAEDIRYNKMPQVNLTQIPNPQEQVEFGQILKKRFPEGTYIWSGGQVGQDCRNHPMHPSQGYQWVIQNKIGLPGLSTCFGFWKIDCDGSWYNSLIGERTLILYLHTHIGAVGGLGNYSIPFRELYHIGGPASVRGYLFGEIGPTYKGIDSLGGKKAFWINAELIFPIAPDMSIKGVIFYDGGSGWDTPNGDLINKNRLRSNGFDFRQAVGFGLRILRPTPIKVDWGFKLDRRKGEKTSEVHLTMAHDF